MSDPKRAELKVKQQRAILAGVVLADEPVAEREPLEELRGLAETAGVDVVASLVQNRQEPDNKTYLGKGKVQELKNLVHLHDAKMVVFDTGLSPGQLKSLEEALGVMIVDRNELILSIFATHARTTESHLQVELAQLLYMRPRLKRMWGHLDRITGNVNARGSGEQQLETDRRLVDVRVTELQAKLKVVELRRERMVAQRHNQLTVSLVGYTNAGKSTLMNALTGADVYVANQLFATLDTRTRSWKVPHWGTVLLSDTVGFIRNLPHNLVASFRSTLEEARHADLLLHVVDASHPAAEHQIHTVNEVLKEIGIDGSQAILVLNKADAVADRSYLDVLRATHADSVTVSAFQKTGLDQLKQMVMDRLSGGYVNADLETNVANGRLFSYLAEHAEVTGQDYADERVTIHCRIARKFLASIPTEDVQVHVTHEPDVNGSSHRSLPAGVAMNSNGAATHDADRDVAQVATVTL